MIAIAIVSTIPALLALIYIGSPTIFEVVVSLSTSGLYASYFIPCSLLLWRRTTGQIRPHTSDDNDAMSFEMVAPSHTLDDNPYEDIAQPRLMWGPWRIPGVFGVINNVYACVYTVFVLFWSFWPPITPATAKNMNYSILMTGVVISFSIVYYYIWGKNQYRGPLVEREVKDFIVERR